MTAAFFVNFNNKKGWIGLIQSSLGIILINFMFILIEKKTFFKNFEDTRMVLFLLIFFSSLLLLIRTSLYISSDFGKLEYEFFIGLNKSSYWLATSTFYILVSFIEVIVFSISFLCTIIVLNIPKPSQLVVTQAVVLQFVSVIFLTFLTSHLAGLTISTFCKDKTNKSIIMALVFGTLQFPLSGVVIDLPKWKLIPNSFVSSLVFLGSSDRLIGIITNIHSLPSALAFTHIPNPIPASDLRIFADNSSTFNGELRLLLLHLLLYFLIFGAVVIKKAKPILISFAIIFTVAFGGIFIHDAYISSTALSKTQENITALNQTITSIQNTIDSAKNGTVQSKLTPLFLETKFTQKEAVALPQNPKYTVNQMDVAKYFTIYLNQLRQLNGEPPITWSAASSEQAYAQALSQNQNAQEPLAISTNAVSWQWAEAAGEEDWIKAYNIQSDQEMAYYIIMTLYDNSSLKGFNANKTGNYADRAYLLYDTPAIGLGISANAISFVSDRNYFSDTQTLNKYNNMLNATTNPATTPLPDYTFVYVNQKLLNTEQNKLNQAKSQLKKEKTHYSDIKKDLILFHF